MTMERALPGIFSQSSRNRIAVALFWFAFAVWALGILLHLFFPRGSLDTEVVARVHADGPGYFQVYFAPDSGGFRADRRTAVSYKGGDWRELRLRMVQPTAGAMRIDTDAGPNRVRLDWIRIRTPAMEEPVEIDIGSLRRLEEEGIAFDPFTAEDGLWVAGSEELIPSPLVWDELPEHFFPDGPAWLDRVAWATYQSATWRFLLIILAVSLAGYLASIPALEPVKGWRPQPPPGYPREGWMNPGTLALIRWLAVFLVVMHHAYGRLGNVAAQPLWPYVQNGPMFLGNSMFLALSGFLVARSLCNNKSSLRFLVRRSLRLLPLLWLFTFGLILVLGPSLTEAGWREYFGSEGFRRLLQTGWLAPDGYVRLPGVMKGGTVNPVLHIFPAFIYGYILLWLFWKVGLLRPVRFLLVLLAFWLAVYLAVTLEGWSIYHTRALQLNAVVTGAAVALFYPRMGHWAPPLAAAVGLGAVAVWMGPYTFWSLYPATLACSFLFVGLARLPAQIPGVPVGGAYCFFLFHWPVQAVLQINFKPTDGLVFFLMTAVVVFGMSAVVEGRILRPIERAGDRWIEKRPARSGGGKG